MDKGQFRATVKFLRKQKWKLSIESSFEYENIIKKHPYASDVLFCKEWFEEFLEKKYLGGTISCSNVVFPAKPELLNDN